MIGVNEKTTGHIVAPDGSLLSRPTTVIGADTAKIIRQYFLWAMRNQLEPVLKCVNCDDHTRDSKATFNIDETQIAIVCQCQIRFFEGASVLDLVTPGKTVKADGAAVADVLMSEDEARLLRLYKKVLLGLGLREALHCNVCFKSETRDGCNASVTTNHIEIRCRCANRRFRGLTI